MTLPRLFGWVMVIFVLYVIISQPTNAAGMTHGALRDMRSAGDSMINFVGGVVHR
ncbi:MAG TPA: hypothetical protein VGM60_14055 [Pseudonocardia sp.]|jgi:hypothetical protein|uniref:hypothetical protein n=1 Tax=Pseudonocardia sp. TaxID=60912 RepID=UPI002F403789